MAKHNLTNFGSVLCFLAFELNNENKNLEKINNYYELLESHIKEVKVSKHIEIFGSECLKEFFVKLIEENKELRMINILKNDLVNQTIFDDFYKEVIEKLEN